MSSFLLLLSPNLDLSNSKGLLMQFLPLVSELPLQPFPTEKYCSVYCLAAVHLVQILEDAMGMPDGLEPTPKVLPFLMAVSRHLCMVDTDPEAGAFKFHFLKSASLQPFVLQLILDAQCALGGSIFIRCHSDYQSFGYSPLFSEYEIVLNDIFIVEDDHYIENSKGEELEGQ